MQGLVESVSDKDLQNHNIFVVLPWLQGHAFAQRYSKNQQFCKLSFNVKLHALSA